MTTGDGDKEFDRAAFCAKRDAAQKKHSQWQTTAYEITQAYIAGERSFNYASLDYASLDYASLNHASLDYASLDNASLDNASLIGASLNYALLIGASLDNASLNRASLNHALLDNASLNRALLDNASLNHASLDYASLIGASLDYASLDYASLIGASLDYASLDNASLIGASGIYQAYAPNLSSRRAALMGGVVIENNTVQLRFWAGCKESVTAEILLACVRDTHADNIHAKQYQAAVEFIQACFEADMESGKWNYLINWKQPTQSE